MAETSPSRLDFFREVAEQVRKVTWPDRKQVQESTGIIVVFMLVVSLIIFGMDQVVSFTLGLLRDTLAG